MDPAVKVPLAERAALAAKVVKVAASVDHPAVKVTKAAPVARVLRPKVKLRRKIQPSRLPVCV